MVWDMPEIEIISEQEQGTSWLFDVCVTDDQGQRYTFDVTLSWSDYDHWSHGRKAPERVVEAAFEFLVEREPASAILSKFDCAIIRRYFSEVDRELPKMI